MIRKMAQICAIVFGSLILLAAAGYVALGYYYSPYFVYGTWINQIYCTGLDVDTVNQALVQAAPAYELEIAEKDGKQEVISGSEIALAIDYTKELNRLKAAQNPLKWGYYYFHPVQLEIVPEVSYDHKLLKQAVENLNCSHLEVDHLNRSPEIKWQSGQYVLQDERLEVVDREKLYQLAETAVEERATAISLTESECYYMPELKAGEQTTYDLWKQIEQAQRTQLVYRDGAQELTLDGKKISEWLCVDEQGSFILEQGKLTFDEEKLNDFIKKLSECFNTKGSVRTWTREDGRVITITSKGKRYIVDEAAERKELLDTLEYGRSITRKPLYSQTGEPREAINLGKTYIEVDMTAQKLYYYKNNELKLTTDIVTGNLSRGHDTPAALCEIYYMQKNRTLHGANYESFVYYWMAVKGHIGIHDATWRDSFGGDIYKTAGSHGCINLPKEKAAELYAMVEVGIPVIMYYE